MTRLGLSPGQTNVALALGAVALVLVAVAGARQSWTGALMALAGSTLLLGGTLLAMRRRGQRANRILGIGIGGIGLATLIDSVAAAETRHWTDETTAGLLILSGSCLLLSWWYRWRAGSQT